MAGAAYPAVIHVNKTLAKFSQHIFEVCSRLLENKRFITLTLQFPIFLIIFLGVRSVRGVQIFEPLGKKLLGRHALGGDFGGLSLDFGYQRMKKKRENHIAYRGLSLFYHRGKGPLGGTPANFFQRAFGVVPDFQETNVHEPNFATPNFVYFFLG